MHLCHLLIDISTWRKVMHPKLRSEHAFILSKIWIQKFWTQKQKLSYRKCHTAFVRILFCQINIHSTFSGYISTITNLNSQDRRSTTSETSYSIHVTTRLNNPGNHDDFFSPPSKLQIMRDSSLDYLTIRYEILKLALYSEWLCLILASFPFLRKKKRLTKLRSYLCVTTLNVWIIWTIFTKFRTKVMADESTNNLVHFTYYNQ